MIISSTIWIIFLICMSTHQLSINFAAAPAPAKVGAKSGGAKGTQVASGPGETNVADTDTGDLCEGNTLHSDPVNEFGLTFLAPCASCVSNAMVKGITCYQNTWTFQNHCHCTNYLFNDCSCWRSLNILGTCAYVIIPLLLAAIVLVVRICLKFPFCPLYSIERKAAIANKRKLKEMQEFSE